MKKLLVFLMVGFTALTLTACNDDDVEQAGKVEVPTELLESLKTEVYNTLVEIGAPLNDDLESYVADEYYWDVEEAYCGYLTFNVVLDTALDQLIDGIVEAELSVAQVQAIIDGVSGCTNAFVDQDMESLINSTLDLLFDANLEGDQLIIVFFEFVQDLDTAILNDLNAVAEKDAVDYKDTHEFFVAGITNTLEMYEMLFDLTDTDKEDALTIGVISLTPALSYVYELESLRSTLDDAMAGNFTLTEDTLFSLVKANFDAYKDAYAGLTETQYTAAYEVLYKLLDNVTGEDTETTTGMTSAEYASISYKMDKAILNAMNSLNNEKYKSDFYNMYEFNVNGTSFNDQDLFNYSIMTSNACKEAFSVFTADELEMFGFKELNDSLTAITSFTYGTTYVESTHSTAMNNYAEAFADVFGIF